MSKNDYSKLKSVSLNSTELLSNTSGYLKTYLAINSIKTVGDLLEFSDDASKLVGFLYYDTLLEFRGFVDLIKQKYLHIDFVTDIYFDKKIKYLSFDMPSSPLWSYGIKANNGKQIDIYTLITRLGFNDKERTVILKLPKEELDGMYLIDLFNKAYNRIIVSAKLKPENQILCNKLLIIMNYYLIKYRFDNDTDFSKSVYEKINELGDILARKYALEQSKKNLEKNLSAGVKK